MPTGTVRKPITDFGRMLEPVLPRTPDPNDDVRGAGTPIPSRAEVKRVGSRLPSKYEVTVCSATSGRLPTNDKKQFTEATLDQPLVRLAASGTIQGGRARRQLESVRRRWAGTRDRYRGS